MAAAVFTLTKVGSRNLGGGALIAYGTLAADEGDYATGGIAPTPTFASLDQISNREPDAVMFIDKDGYKWFYDNVNKLVKLFALNLTGGAEVNIAYTEHTAAALAAGVGGTVYWLAWWMPRIP